ncbi:hypothetical protein TrST_g2402 [Triparma strigata]|nr:hypothetical protein TrST_g2402 [Triparma strigata]
MLAAMMIKTKLDAGETSSEQGLYDVILVGIQFMSPLLLVGILLKKGETAARGLARSVVGSAQGRETSAEGLGLELVERGEGGSNQAAVLGGDSWPEPSNPRNSKFEHFNPHRDMPTPAGKNKADNGRRPNSSFDAFKNPNLTLGGKGGSKKNSKTPALKGASKNRGLTAAQKGSQFKRISSVTSSFSGNEDVWIEHKSEEGGRKGETYYHQPSTGKTVWERPVEGETIKLANKKNISKEPPKRKSMFAIPKEHLEDAPIGPPKIPPPTAEDDDIGPPPFPPPTESDDDIGPPPFPPPSAESSPPQPKPVCQWTEEWDTEFGAIYYLNIDGETSTWDMPDDFWRDEER